MSVLSVLSLLSVLVVAILAPTTNAEGSSAAAVAAPSEPSQHTAGKRLRGFPTQRSAGVPLGWSPKRTINGDYDVNKAGAVIEDVRVYGDVNINAHDVTLNRVEVVGGVIQNWAGSTCYSGLNVRRTTIKRAPGEATSGDSPALSTGGYVARRVAIVGLPEGFRVGGSEECGPVKIVNSYARVVSPTICDDWHGDALQGYDGGHLDLRNTTLRLVEREGCGGTAPFFYPDSQGNTSVSIDRLLVVGGGYSFRLGMPGSVSGLHIKRGGYSYGPILVRCDLLSAWDSDIAAVRNGQPVPVRRQRCNTDES
ncbi:hypothetical protein [Nocardioides dilutus]